MRIPESLVPEITDLLATTAARSDAPNDGFDLNRRVTTREQPHPFQDCEILQPNDAKSTLTHLRSIGVQAQTLILDPWYSASPHRVDLRSKLEAVELIWHGLHIAKHIFVWGWPADVALLVERIPKPLIFRHWLTWHYTNTPSRTRGWRPSQQACLHLSHPDAELYPENFPQHALSGQFRFSADSVITAGNLTGFAGRSQATGHPAQKPIAAIEPLILMTTKPGDVVLDPMAGSGTTGEVALMHGRKTILSDISSRYTAIIRSRCAKHSIS